MRFAESSGRAQPAKPRKPETILVDENLMTKAVLAFFFMSRDELQLYIVLYDSSP